MKAEFLDISASQIPIKKRYTFDGISYVFRFKYNTRHGYYTVEMYDATDRVFVFSAKIVYGMNLTESAFCPIKTKIIPLNLQELAGNSKDTSITPDNFGTRIKLYTRLVEDDTL